MDSVSITQFILDQSLSVKSLKEQFSYILSRFNISIPQWFVLDYLSSREHIKISDISERLKCETPFVTNLIYKLNDKGLIEIEGSSTDRRIKFISLSQKGESKISDIRIELEKLNEKIKAIKDSDWKSYRIIMDSVLDSIKEAVKLPL